MDFRTQRTLMTTGIPDEALSEFLVRTPRSIHRSNTIGSRFQTPRQLRGDIYLGVPGDPTGAPYVLGKIPSASSLESSSLNCSLDSPPPDIRVGALNGPQLRVGKSRAMALAHLTKTSKMLSKLRKLSNQDEIDTMESLLQKVKVGIDLLGKIEKWGGGEGKADILDSFISKIEERCAKLMQETGVSADPYVRSLENAIIALGGQLPER